MTNSLQVGALSVAILCAGCAGHMPDTALPTEAARPGPVPETAEVPISVTASGAFQPPTERSPLESQRPEPPGRQPLPQDQTGLRPLVQSDQQRPIQAPSPTSQPSAYPVRTVAALVAVSPTLSAPTAVDPSKLLGDLSSGARTNFDRVAVNVTLENAEGEGRITGRNPDGDVVTEDQSPVGNGTHTVVVSLRPGSNAITLQWTSAGDDQSSSNELKVIIEFQAPHLSNPRLKSPAISLGDFETGIRVRGPDAVLTVKIANEAGAPGKIYAKNAHLDADPIEPVAANSSGDHDITVKLQSGANPIAFQWKPDDGSLPSQALQVVLTLDQTGPLLESAELIQDPRRGDELYMRFTDDDWPESLASNSFVIYRQDSSGKFTERIDPQGTPQINGRFISLAVPKLYEGLYELRLYSSGQPDGIDVLKDDLGNVAKDVVTFAGNGKGQRWEFTATGDRKFGRHVAFPQYAPPKYEKPPSHGFNPADFVQTRVVRLYYYRDAHRVAQIVNRNVRSLNQAAVKQAERRAEKARTEADSKTDERRKLEREAVRAAAAARTAENKLFAAQQTLSLLRDLQGQIQDTGEKIDAAPDDSGQKTALERRRTDLGHRVRQLGGDPHDLDQTIHDAVDDIKRMEQAVANLRQEAIRTQEAATEADAVESRARENQFRQEVAAAEEDPDTYVAGDVNSVDPVTQVSISVIGEGLLQLRGPIKGINKIRTMVNQIDSPLGQIKIGINTIQVNGEHGNRMETVIGRIEGHVDLSRFLTNQSLLLLRRAIQEGAASVAQQCDAAGGHYQVDRDRKYLYAFFGRDFIDELYEMDSEFLHTENKVLSLHSMDTISLNRALFILALAKNDVRQQILARFMELVCQELPEAEWDFRRSSELHPHKTRAWLPRLNKERIEAHTLEAVCRNARQRYHFRNLRGFFETGIWASDTINPMQREFLRLAQIFKSQMIAEVELKQRIIERALIEDPSNDESSINEQLREVHERAMPLVRTAYNGLIENERNLQVATSEAVVAEERIRQLSGAFHLLDTSLGTTAKNKSIKELINAKADELQPILRNEEAQQAIRTTTADFARSVRRQLSPELQELYPSNSKFLSAATMRDTVAMLEESTGSAKSALDTMGGAMVILQGQRKELDELLASWARINRLMRPFLAAINDPYISLDKVDMPYKELLGAVLEAPTSTFLSSLRSKIERAYMSRFLATQTDAQIERAELVANRTRQQIDHRKLLNFLIDEQEEKYIELVEGTRAHIAAVDNYLKRLAIAMEDDFKVQFYDPAFVRIRAAAREYDVNLGQVERTTILTNNRALAKVTPQATMEFDLPKRNIAIVEALDGAKALAEDYGALLNDPTFLAAYQLMGGGQQASTVRNLVPGLPTSTDQHEMGLVPDEKGKTDSALQGLVPDPSVYKFETGTGFEIRPVIQPDGDSVIYDFNYMYTTNVREPVDADEKHLGRIKRHFVRTQVQTSSFELREISRYQVALKASRTSRGVPLFEDIPAVGALFRPAPSDESSIQQNIILGSTTVYPTLFDLMGLRWAPQVVDLDHLGLLDTEHVVRGRQNTIRDYVFDEASRRVDKFLHLRRIAPDQYRPDLYRQQRAPSPYHPNGYTYPSGIKDPTGQRFERRDRRPPEMRIPPYDAYRPRPLVPEAVEGLPAEPIYPGPGQPEIINGRPMKATPRPQPGLYPPQSRRSAPPGYSVVHGPFDRAGSNRSLSDR